MNSSRLGPTFSKLEALGNDFVLLEQDRSSVAPQAEQIRALADRKTGIGFDQLLILRPSPDQTADRQVSIFNADGSPARQCGNGMRAIGLWLHQQMPAQDRFLLDTAAGTIEVHVASAERIRASMGQPDFAATAVGLHTPEALAKRLAEIPAVQNFGTVSVGNPHLVLLLQRPATQAEVLELGAELSRWHGFADGANVSFAHQLAPDRVSLQVHERGAGVTRACGSAACATAAWLLKHNQGQSPVRVTQPGGELVIDWRGPGHAIFMTGPARRIYDGKLA
ncbi:MAG: diaminopimelate epimerase [Wenzhouxiangella sp.]